MPQRFQEFHILFVKTVTVARFAGMMNKAFRMESLVAPVDGVDIVPLNLVGGGGTSPEKSLRENDCRKVVQVQHIRPLSEMFLD